MLDLMRRKAQSPTLQATVVIIILVFIFWGVGNQSGNGPNSVLTVNGTQISYQQYEKAYNQMMDQYRQKFGGQIPDALLKTLNIKEQVIQQLIDRTLVLQEADNLGIHVSDQEVRNYIEKIPSFQVNGVFNVNSYRQILGASRLTVADFEGSVRSDLLAKKVISALSQFGIVPEFDLQSRFDYENAERNLEFVKFTADAFKKKVVVSDQELQKFYDEHKRDYQTEEQRKLEYLTFLEANEKDIEVSDQEVKDYYQKNQDLYTVPEKRRARHILFKVAPDASEKDKEAKRKRAEEVLAQAKAGDDFAGLATIYSEDSSASKGGDLGFFSKGQMVKPFANAVFSMKPGEISDIVETQFGFHIIKLEEIKPASVKPLAEVKSSIVAKLKAEKSKSMAFTDANAAYEQIIMAGSLDKFAKDSHMPLQETGFIEKSAPPKGVVSDPAFLKAAFSLGKGELSSLVELPQGYAIIYVADIKAPETPPLAKVREKVVKDFVEAKAREMAAVKAGEMLAAVKAGKDFAGTAKEYGVEVQQSAYFSRLNQYNTNLPPAMVEGGLKLSAAAPYPADIVTQGDASFVYRFLEVKDIDKDAFAAQRKQYEERLKVENTNALVSGWLESVRQKAEITRNEKLL
ncbi:MAG: SurA N-terminal domain-containing protein [Deltaproteobacteria bacterium]